jgi:hypothetical protein
VAIDEAHRLGLKTIAHTKALDDWKGLIRAGVDATTHTVEDVPVDAELLALIKQRLASRMCRRSHRDCRAAVRRARLASGRSG